MTTDPAPAGGLHQYPDEDQVFAPLYDSAEFAEFEQMIDDMLEVLVGQWLHLAAPRAASSGIRRANLPKAKKPAQ